MSAWAIDLGTTNTSVARWHETEARPELIHLPSLCRQSGPDSRLEVRYSVPSSVWVLKNDDLATRIGRWKWLERLTFLGQQALIGRAAQDADAGLRRPNFIPGFKRALMQDALQPLARVGGESFPAVQVGRLFLRELLASVTQAKGERPRDIVFSTPVDCYEHYRAWLRSVAQSLGVSRFRCIDEPVAAAIGYGLRVDEARLVLVIDFGGGTLDLALIRLQEGQAAQGKGEVIAKCGAPIGGDLVDAWMVQAYAERLDYDLRQDDKDEHRSWWYHIMLEEARRVKEGLFLQPQETFFLTPPPEFQRLPGYLRSRREFRTEQPFTRDELVALLDKNGLYAALERAMAELEQQCTAKGIRADAISDVLMVGGSTLLPGVYPRVEQRYGRDRVRAWQPFEAVAYGAACFAGGHLITSDFVTHDYAVMTWRKEGQETRPEYQVVVKAGTPYPTPEAVWKRHLTPTCSLGEPERIFKLVICELGVNHSKGQAFSWDARGDLHTLNEGPASGPLVIPLNESDPTLGYLEPPHYPNDRKARLEVSFGINSDRWLWATVFDLQLQKFLMQEKPVVRLK